MELLLYLLTLFLKVCQKFLARDGVSKLKRLSELYIEILNKLKLIVFVDIQLDICVKHYIYKKKKK